MKGSKMEVKAKLTISMAHGAQQNAYFETVEQAEKVMKDFSHALGGIREFGNDDISKMFNYKGAGAIYTLDLRKAMSASIEIIEEWGPVINNASLKIAKNYKENLNEIEDQGLADIYERIEKNNRRD